jgi:hypothetical protein
MFQPLEALLNRGIRASTDAARRCRALEGSSFRIELDGLGLGLTLVSRGDSLQLSPTARPTPASAARRARWRGSPPPATRGCCVPGRCGSAATPSWRGTSAT